MEAIRNQPFRLGILMLDTRFPRIVGDIGNPASFSFPVLPETMAGFGPRDAVFNEADGAVLPPVLKRAVERLEDAGVSAITTSCGFLVLYQAALARTSRVPVITSSLLQVRELNRALPDGKRVGVITASAEALGARHLRAAEAPLDTPVVGMRPDGAFAKTFIENGTTLDRAAVGQEVVEAGMRLVGANSDVGAIVLECTNLPPYRDALVQALGLPVYDMQTYLHRLFGHLR